MRRYPSEDKSQSPMAAELPMLTPLTDESTQNIQNSSPQVISSPISSPIFNESLETNVPPENFAPRYPQRSNKGVPKKQYEPILKPMLNIQLAIMSPLIDCLNRMHLLLINHAKYLFLVVCRMHWQIQNGQKR